MNILYTITSYPPAMGGTQLVAHQLASRFAQAGDGIEVAAYWDRTRTDWLVGTTLRAPSQSGEYAIDGVRVHRLAWSSPEKLKLLPWVVGYWWLQGLAIRHISKLVVGKLRTMGQGWQVIHNIRQGREPLSFASLELARSLGIPFVFTPVHHPRWGGWMHRHYQALYRMADAVIALTKAEQESLVRLGVQRDRIHVIGVGPVLAPHADGAGFRLKHGLGSDPVVLFLGTHYRYKGLETLALAAYQVWEKYPSTRFVFVGLPTAHSRRLFAHHADPRLIPLGTMDLLTKTGALAACDLLCVPSTQESFGVVYTEAWAMGKPVIGGDIPAVREIISDGQDGYLVQPDPRQLADRICALVGDRALRLRMGQMGLAKVTENYTWDKLAERTRQIYSQLLSGREAIGP